jgi:hypothetical protein
MTPTERHAAAVAFLATTPLTRAATQAFATQTGCSFSTAQRVLRRVSHGEPPPAWGGKRPGAGRPPRTTQE